MRHEQSEELLDLRMECLGQRLEDAKAEVDLSRAPTRSSCSARRPMSRR